MHVPDGFFDAATSAGAVAASAGVLAVAVRRSSAELEDRQAPLAGLVAAFVFAAQVVNFPVAAGTSGHLLGGALAAILVGPWAGTLCVAVVVVVQLLFADGGVTAVGINVLLIAVVPALAGAPLFHAMRRVLPATRAGASLAAGVAAGLTVPLAAAAFTGLYALGGTAEVPLGSLATAMLGVHALIGVGEGLITATTVGAVLAVRPDLVRGGRGLGPALVVGPSPADAGGAGATAGEDAGETTGAAR